MISITRFIIDNNTYFEVLVPELPDKDNYFCEPTEKLHVFDIVTVVYCGNSIKTELLEDEAAEIIGIPRCVLTEALVSKRILPDHIPLGSASLWFSINSEKVDFNVDFGSFWLWDAPSPIQTWLYNKDNKIYLEVSSTYPWLSRDPEPSENYYSFDEYIRNYKPIAVYEISRETAQQWLEQCNTILDTMDAPSGYIRWHQD
jgi:hypothetical protein